VLEHLGCHAVRCHPGSRYSGQLQGHGDASLHLVRQPVRLADGHRVADQLADRFAGPGLLRGPAEPAGPRQHADHQRHGPRVRDRDRRHAERPDQLQGYSQNHYGTANFTNDPTPIDRTVTAGSDGSATISDLRPASNTRIRARVKGCAFGTNALGSVINVRTQLTLAAKRTGTRTVVISGGSIPARPGGLIVGIYRDGVLIGQARADQTSGQYSVTLHFPASDQGKRINLNARTGQDAQNAPGQSNTRSLLIT